MNWKQFYLSKINEGMLLNDQSIIEYYNQLLQEELRKEYIVKIRKVCR